MKDSSTFNLAEHRLLRKNVMYCNNNIEPNDFIGYERLKSFFGSLIPDTEFSDDENIEYISEFKEMYPGIYPTNNSVTSSAVMFSGEFGCGKHTADKVLTTVILKQFEKLVGSTEVDDCFEYYSLDLSSFTDGNSKKEVSEQIELIMSTIIQKASSDTEVMFYFSLGDVTEIMNSKKTAKCFSEMVNKLLLNHKTTSIVTCCYDGSASNIKDKLKKSFYVYEFEAPDYEMRMTYFEELRKKYFNIIFEPTDDELAEMTEDFTFAMLKRLTAFILTEVKYKCIEYSDNLDITMFFETADHLEDDTKITVTAGAIGRYVVNLKNTKYVPPIKQQMPMYVPSPMVISQQQDFSQQNKSKEKLTEEQEQELEAQSAVSQIDTVSGLFDFMDSIAPTSSYVPDNFEEGKFEMDQRLSKKKSIENEQSLSDDN